jgi:hypothetical protein
LTNLGSESETCVGSRVHLVGVSISFEKNFYRLPFTPPPLFGSPYRSFISSTYHPQTDGQSERTNQILEYMLRACALKHGGSWDKSLPYAEFAYNNSYQSSLKMAPFEAFYRRKCRTPLFWNHTGEVISLVQRL